MRNTFTAALLAATLAVGSSRAVLAQDAGPPAAAATTATAPTGPPSVEWTVQDLLANPGAKAVLEKELPGLEADPRLDMVKSMSLKSVAQYPEAQIDDAKLAAIQADLAALPK